MAKAQRIHSRIGFSKRQTELDVKRALSDTNACYVLITCGEPSPDGRMEVSMTYQGDPALAAYLVESAQHYTEFEG